MKKILAILLFGVLSSSSADDWDWYNLDPSWGQWHPVSCEYGKDMSWVFENCNPYPQELQEQERKRCGEEKWKKGKELEACGVPKATIIKADNIQKAYEDFFKHTDDTIHFKDLPLENTRKDTFIKYIQYTWKGAKHLEIAYSVDDFSMDKDKNSCQYIHFFDLGDNNIEIVRVNGVYDYGLDCSK